MGLLGNLPLLCGVVSEVTATVWAVRCGRQWSDRLPRDGLVRRVARHDRRPMGRHGDPPTAGRTSLNLRVAMCHEARRDQLTKQPTGTRTNGENVVDEHSSADIKAFNWVFWVMFLAVGAVWFCLADALLAPWLTSVGMPAYVGELVTGVVACGILFAAPSLASRFDRRRRSSSRRFLTLPAIRRPGGHDGHVLTLRAQGRGGLGSVSNGSPRSNGFGGHLVFSQTLR